MCGVACRFTSAAGVDGLIRLCIGSGDDLSTRLMVIENGWIEWNSTVGQHGTDCVFRLGDQGFVSNRVDGVGQHAGPVVH